MSAKHDNIEHQLDINEVYIIEKLIRKEVDRQIKERQNSTNDPDLIDEALHKLLEKLEQCYRGILYEHPSSDDIGRLVRNVLAPDTLFKRSEES